MRIFIALLVFAGASTGQVSNAADAQAGLSNGPLVPGSLATIQLDCCGAGAGAQQSVSISFRSAGSTLILPAQVVSANTSTATFQVPAKIPPGDAQLIYKIQGQPTQWQTVTIAPAAFSLFHTGPIGPLRAQNIALNGTVSVNGLANPVQPGQAVVLWGTGLGSTPPDSIRVTAGGVVQTLLYAGPAPGQLGIDQINFRIAPATPDGCYVPLRIDYGLNAVSSFISKTSDGLPCRHPFGLSTDSLRKLDLGQAVSTEGISLSSSLSVAAADRAARSETVNNTFYNRSSGDLANILLSQASAPTSTCLGQSATGTLGIFGFVSVPGAGFPSVRLQGPSVTLNLDTQFSQASEVSLSSSGAMSLAGGKWTYLASGGSLSAPSSFDFVLPPPVRITNGFPLFFRRERDQAVTWDGSGFDSTSTARLSLSVLGSNLPFLTCSAPAGSGLITIPANLLASLSANSTASISLSVAQSGIGFSAGVLTGQNPGELVVTISWQSSDTRPVDIQ